MRILLAEDTAGLNRAVAKMLELSGYEVDAVFDGAAALEKLHTDSYDGIILDIMMPKVDGLAVLKDLRERRNTTPVLLLTAKSEVDDRVAGLDAGADDYLPKPFAMKELLARVSSMTRRARTYNRKSVRYGNVELDGETFAMTAANGVRLSVKEFELMYTLMTNPDLSLSTDYLLEHVWGDEPEAQEDTLWLYVSYLRQKLRAVGSSVTISGERGGSFRIQGGSGDEE